MGFDPSTLIKKFLCDHKCLSYHSGPTLGLGFKEKRGRKQRKWEWEGESGESKVKLKKKKEKSFLLSTLRKGLFG